MRRHALVVVLASSATLVACTVTPPRPAVSLAPLPIHASRDATWNAAVDVFAEDNIPIRTMDHADGFIATTALSTDGGQAGGKPYADCGSYLGRSWANTVRYTVLVRGDARTSTVRVTAAWIGPNPVVTGAVVSCSTTGLWELRTEAAIRARAEATRTRASAP